MLQYQIENKADSTYAVVLGLGVIEPGQTKTFTSDEAEGFVRQTGLRLTQDNLPESLELTIVGGDK